MVSCILVWRMCKYYFNQWIYLPAFLGLIIEGVKVDKVVDRNTYLQMTMYTPSTVSTEPDTNTMKAEQIELTTPKVKEQTQYELFCSEPIYVGEHNQYKLQEQLGCGAFGEVYRASSAIFPHIHYAVKLQTTKPKQCSYLEHEVQIYKTIMNYNHERRLDKANQHMADLWYMGRQVLVWNLRKTVTNVMVMDLLGRSLGSIARQYRKLPIRTVLQMGIQMITAVQYLHQRGIIHRDIKPDNLCLGRKGTKLFLVDFGLAYHYIVNGRHIAQCKADEFVGNKAYCSRRAEWMQVQVRRDDMESIGYVLVKLATGELPWMSKEREAANWKVKSRRTEYKKNNITLDKLCKGLPKCIKQYIQMVRNLKFEQEPQYQQYRDMFQNSLEELGHFFCQGYTFK